MPLTRDFINTVFAPQEGERVIILTDDQPAQQPLLESFQAIFTDMGFTPVTITFSPTGANSAPLPEIGRYEDKDMRLTSFLDKLGSRDIVLAITRYSASGPIFSRMKQGFRAATMPSAKLEMAAFDGDYTLLKARARFLKDKLNMAEAATIEFSTGHLLTLDLREHRARADDGDCTEPGKGINLPSGEAFIVPYEGEDSRTGGEWPVMVDGDLVVMNVSGNRIGKVAGKKAMELNTLFMEDGMRRNVAELGLGCNEAATIIGNILQDEKVPGIHLAYGMSSHLGGTMTPAMFQDGKSLHEDIVYAKGSPISIKRAVLIINEDEELLMDDGEFVIEGYP
ncbi:MAG: hypothetical protein ABIH34_03880 [Nanoarchaeota archaeon]